MKVKVRQPARHTQGIEDEDSLSCWEDDSALMLGIHGLQPAQVADLSAIEIDSDSTPDRIANTPQSTLTVSFAAPVGAVATVGDGAVVAPGGTSGVVSAASSVTVTASEVAPPEVSTPGLQFSFDGIGYTGWIPPDPHGAAGLDHLVSVVNSSIVFHTKVGTQQFNQTLDGFFGSSVSLFDPKVIYDHHANRFVVVALELQGRGTGTQADDVSRIRIAVSDDGNPNGTWYRYSFNTLISDGTNNYWADYPGLAVDGQRVYITSNYFRTEGSGFLDSFAWVIDTNAGLYSGGTATAYRYQPYTQSEHGTSDFTLQPAQVLAGDVPGAAGTFLVGFDGFVGGSDDLDVIRMDFSGDASTGSFNFQNVVVGDVTNAAVPDSPQLGTSALIDAGDDRTYHAVWRNNSLWVVNTVNPGSGVNAGQATAHWYQINTSNLASLALTQHGDIGAQDLGSNTHTYYPSVAVNQNGVAAFGFAASGSSIYAGSYYAIREPGDPLNTLQGTQALRVGQGTYSRLDSSFRNRWGDYTAIVVDPSNNSDFWVFNEHATASNTWQTAWGKVNVIVPSWGQNGASDQLADFNGDQKADVLQIETSGKADVWTSTGTALNAYSQWGSGARPTDVAVDLNGDGKCDLVEMNTSGTIYAWITNAAGTSFNNYTLWGSGARPSDKLADIDGNGRADLVEMNENGNIYLWFSQGNKFANYFVAGHGARPSDFFGDFNGDGRADIIEPNENGNVYVWQSNGSGFNDYSVWGKGARPSDKLGDIDGNGRDDLIELHENGNIYLWFSQGNKFADYIVAGHGSRPSDQIGDVNGDGKDDIVELHENGNIYVWLSNGNGFNNYSVWGTGARPTDRLADFNGDGKADIIELNENGNAYVWLSTGASFSPYTVWGKGFTTEPSQGGALAAAAGESAGSSLPDVYATAGQSGYTPEIYGAGGVLAEGVPVQDVWAHFANGAADFGYL